MKKLFRKSCLSALMFLLILGNLTGLASALTADATVQYSNLINPVTIATGALKTNFTVNGDGSKSAWATSTGIYLYNDSDKSVTQIYASTTVISVAMSANGTKLAFTQGSPTYTVNVIDLATLNVTLITNAAKGTVGTPSISADGSIIGFAYATDLTASSYINNKFGIYNTTTSSLQVLIPATVVSAAQWPDTWTSKSPIIISPDGAFAYLATYYNTVTTWTDGSITKWDIGTSTKVWTYRATGNLGLERISSDGQYLYGEISNGLSTLAKMQTSSALAPTAIRVGAAAGPLVQDIDPLGRYVISRGLGIIMTDGTVLPLGLADTAGVSGDGSVVYAGSVVANKVSIRKINLTEFLTKLPSIGLPLAPIDLAGVASKDFITLTWDGSILAAGGHRIMRDGILVGVTAPGVMTFKDTTVGVGVTYNYTIAAYNATGVGPSSSLLVTAEDGASVKLGLISAKAGQVASLGGLTWRVISDNYLVSMDSLGLKTYETSANDSMFSPIRSTGIGYQLNQVYYPILNSAEKAVIVSFPWRLMDKDGIFIKSVSAYIGLMSKQDLTSPSVPFVKPVGWTLTPNIYPTPVSFYTSDSVLVSKTLTAETYPAVHISSNAVVTGEGTPESPFIFNGVGVPLPASTLTSTAVTKNSTSWSWSNVADATLYTLKRGTEVVYTGTDRTFTDSGLTSNTAYTYSLSASDDTRVSAASTKTVTTVKEFAPPATFTHTALSDTSATLGWAAVAGATLYTVKRDGEVIYSGSALTFVDTGLSPQTTYSYSVTAYNGTETSAATLHTLTTSAQTAVTPTNFKLDNKSSVSVRMSWITNGSDTYVVKRNGVPVYSNVASFFIDSGLEPGTEYVYTLEAKRGASTSPAATLTVTTDQEIISPPDIFVVDHKSYDSIDLHWGKVGNALLYTVTSNGVPVYEGDATSFSATGLSQDTEYIFEVVAKKNSLVSTPMTLTARTNLELDSAPQIPSASSVSFAVYGETASSLSFSWTAAQDADSYILTQNNKIVYEGTDLGFVDSGLLPDTGYTYSLKGVNVHGIGNAVSIAGHTVGAPPVAPTNFKATRVYMDAASLQWGMVTDATYYKVFRDTDVLVYSGPLTTFKDVTLSPSSNFDYTVYAVNKWGQSSPVYLTVTTTAEAPAIVVSPAPAVEGSITFSFDVINGAYEHHLERNPHWIYTTNGDGTYTETKENTALGTYETIGIVTPVNGKLSFTESGVAPSADYHYNIVAVKNNETTGVPEVIGRTEVVVNTPADGSGATVDEPEAPSPSPSTSPKPSPTATPLPDGIGTGAGPESGSVAVIPSATASSSATPTAIPTVTKVPAYTDLLPAYAEDSINELSALGIVKGYSDGTFKANNLVSRAEFAILLTRVTGLNTKLTSIERFKDLSDNAWYAKELSAALGAGITKGFNNGTYKPNNSIPREQAAIMLSNILDLKSMPIVSNTLTYPDFAEVTSWAKASVIRISSYKLTKGLLESYFKPKASLTRGDAAVLIVNLLHTLDVK